MTDAVGPAAIAARTALYRAADLLAGFDAADRLSLLATVDSRIHGWWRDSTGIEVARDAQALHDGRMRQAVEALARSHARSVAVMGGHRLARGSPTYRCAALIGRRLAQAGVLVATGGGPGAMEAAHLGAALSLAGPDELEAAFDRLTRQPSLPQAATDDDAARAAIHRWFHPAIELAQACDPLHPSIAIPTWQLQGEPFTPLATHIAKLFDNAVREDLLIDLAAGGAVFLPGKAGTVWEIFQFCWKNFYDQFDSGFAPMVFFGRAYWTADLPVLPLVDRLFADSAQRDRVRDHVLVTDDVDECCDFLLQRRQSVRVPG